jgi:hypothetical protein
MGTGTDPASLVENARPKNQKKIVIAMISGSPRSIYLIKVWGRFVLDYFPISIRSRFRLQELNNQSKLQLCKF